MAKDARLTFRVQAELKAEIEKIAAREKRSVAQVCEAFLVSGADTYRKQGAKALLEFLDRNLARKW